MMQTPPDSDGIGQKLLRSRPGRYRIPLAAFLFIVAGGLATLLPDGSFWRHRVWMVGLVLTSAPILWGTARGIIRGKFAADLVAALAVVAAFLLGQPVDKVEVVKQLIGDGESVVMMGDGTNDAPALSTATVGIALASHGRGIATEAADVILLADDPTRLMDGIEISRRTMRIARQSIYAGLGISTAGMMVAAAGYITPLGGAAIQEVVDLAVIFNALRASRGAYGKR